MNSVTYPVPEQLRQRRAASYRVPPLHNGYRDPLDDINPAATRTPDCTAGTAWVKVSPADIGLHLAGPAALMMLRLMQLEPRPAADGYLLPIALLSRLRRVARLHHIHLEAAL